MPIHTGNNRVPLNDIGILLVDKNKDYSWVVIRCLVDNSAVVNALPY